MVEGDAAWKLRGKPVSAVCTNGDIVRTTFYCFAENFKVFTITTSNLFKIIKNKMSLNWTNAFTWRCAGASLRLLPKKLFSFDVIRATQVQKKAVNQTTCKIWRGPAAAAAAASRKTIFAKANFVSFGR